MEYKVDFGIWGSIFALPTSVADRHLKLCSESQLKVLLLVFRDAPNAVDVQYIAKRLGLTPTQVTDALDYWVQTGVFCCTEPAPAPQRPNSTVPVQAGPCGAGNSAVTAPAPQRPNSGVTPPGTVETTEGQDGQRITTIHARGKLTPSQINLMSKTDPNLPWLLEQLQQRLGRPLSPAEVETVAYLYSYLQLTPDYLLMAVEYCKVTGKTNMRYIEKLVVGWVDAGIDTHDKAERHILELSRRVSDEALVCNMFGIRDRELSSNEKKYIHIWFGEYGCDAELVRLAYERTIDNTGKVAFPYLHKILTQWQSQGITTAEQAISEMAARPSGTKNSDPSFDLREIERVMRQNTQA